MFNASAGLMDEIHQGHVRTKEPVGKLRFLRLSETSKGGCFGGAPLSTTHSAAEFFLSHLVSMVCGTAKPILQVGKSVTA